MKKTFSAILLLCAIGLTFSACDILDNTVGKSGMKCDSPEIISLTEQILNNQIRKESSFTIDTSNIVIWDYNKVGRYECKAKINGLTKDGFLNTWMLESYGLSLDQKTNKISGWIKYNTYKTTTDGYYVEIQRLSQ
ncbi:MAG TPA: hypothetical protein EYO73_05460 [Sulfurimonas sp.]|nr:hypothetical protein [Sulfurimonas sp.]